PIRLHGARCVLSCRSSGLTRRSAATVGFIIGSRAVDPRNGRPRMWMCKARGVRAPLAANPAPNLQARMSDPNHPHRAVQYAGGQTAMAGDSGGSADSPGASPAPDAPAESRDGTRSTTAASLSPSAIDLAGSPAGSGTIAASSSAYGTTRPSGARVPKWLGKRVGRFRLVALLGRGSWGRV